MKNQAKTPAWSPELHILPCLIEEEIDRGDMREVVEIGGLSGIVTKFALFAQFLSSSHDL